MSLPLDKTNATGSETKKNHYPDKSIQHPIHYALSNHLNIHLQPSFCDFQALYGDLILHTGTHTYSVH